MKARPRPARPAVDAPHVERAYRRSQGRHRQRTISARGATFRSGPGERARHEPHAHSRGARAPLAGGVSRPRRRARLFRRARDGAADSRHLRRAAAARRGGGGARRRARHAGGRGAASATGGTCRSRASQDYRESENANVQFHLAIAACARNDARPGAHRAVSGAGRSLHVARRELRAVPGRRDRGAPRDRRRDCRATTAARAPPDGSNISIAAAV